LIRENTAPLPRLIAGERCGLTNCAKKSRHPERSEGSHDTCGKPDGIPSLSLRMTKIFQGAVNRNHTAMKNEEILNFFRKGGTFFSDVLYCI